MRTAGLIVALMGLPGAGKSTVARHLCRTLDLWLVDRDQIRAAMFGADGCSEADKEAGNRAVWAAVDVNCRLGRASVVDGMTFARRDQRDALRRCAQPYGCRVLPLLLQVPREAARHRVGADVDHGGHPAADRGPALVDAVAARFEAPPPDAAVIDASRGVEDLCGDAEVAVRRALAQAGR